MTIFDRSAPFPTPFCRRLGLTAPVVPAPVGSAATRAHPPGIGFASPRPAATGGGYRGWMQVIADGDGSMLTLGLHTTHVERADHDVAATLDAIRRLVESTV
jgi:hypothetical protein